MMLEFKNVRGINSGFNLQDISFGLEEGFILGIVGKNGAGKTTLLRYITDPDIKYTGEILYRGKNIKNIGPGLFNFVSVISDDNKLFESITARRNAECLSVFYSDWNQELFLEAAEKIGVPMNVNVGRMSRGEKLKLQMALAMAHNTKLYLMDEATSGMDPVFRKEFYHMLHEMLLSDDISVIMTNHNMEEIEIHMDYLARIQEGRLVEYGEVQQVE